MKLYGSLNNRLEEGRMFCDEIKVGTGMTEYYYSDRHAYEVVAVKDQKHVSVREYDHRLIGEAYTDDYELISNPDRPVREMERRGDVWYWSVTVTVEYLEQIEKGDNAQYELFRLAMNGFDVEKIKAKGYQTKRSKANVSFGVADYHYDWSF